MAVEWTRGYVLMLHTKPRIDRTTHSLTIGLYRIYSKLAFTVKVTGELLSKTLHISFRSIQTHQRKQNLIITHRSLKNECHRQTENFFNILGLGGERARCARSTRSRGRVI